MKNKNLHNITSTGFKTPDDYFKTFDEKIASKLKPTNKTLNKLKNLTDKLKKKNFGC